MLNIDLRSVILLAAILALLMAGVVALLRRSFPDSVKGLNAWAWGTLLACLGGLLFSGRGKLPDLLTMVAANAILLTGLLYMYIGLRRLLGLPVPMRRWIWLIVAPLPLFLWLLYVERSYAPYRLAVSALPLALFAAMGWTLLKVEPRTIAVRIVFAVLLVHALVIVAYLAYHVVFSEAGIQFLDAVPIQAAYVLSYASTLLLLSVGFILMASDQMRHRLEHSIAERQRSEQELQSHRDRLHELVVEQTADLVRAKEAAEAASRAKSDFLASMSHELRTPLNAVLGYSQLLAMDPDLPDAVHGQAREIEQAGQHLLVLVNDLIDLARIEAGKLDVSLEPVDLCAVVDEGMALVRPLAQKNGIALDIDAGLQNAPRVRADHTRLRQVLVNLVSNAVKYNRPGGSVRLSCQGRGGGKVRVAVTDTGHGIQPELQERLFNAFDRLGKERSTTEGAGIGLIISRRLVEAMGGELGLDSVPGQGSTFWVELPLAAA